MTVTNVDANSTKNLGQLLVQQIMAQGSGSSSSTSSSSGTSGDQLSLSPAAKALAQVPAAVTQAMKDLMYTHKDIKGDSAQLKAYLQANPHGLTSVLASLNRSTGTYSASGAVAGNDNLMQILGGGSTGTGTSAGGGPLQALLGNMNQDPLLAALGNDGSDSNSTNLFG
jgi:hypothetical protein